MFSGKITVECQPRIYYNIEVRNVYWQKMCAQCGHLSAKNIIHIISYATFAVNVNVNRIAKAREEIIVENPRFLL